MRAMNWIKNETKFRKTNLNTLFELKDSQYENYLIKKYQITFKEFNEMLLNQNNLCGICETPFNRTPVIDHDHRTGKIRGLLCLKCNTAIGMLKENTKIIHYAINWLKENKLCVKLTL